VSSSRLVQGSQKVFFDIPKVVRVYYGVLAAWLVTTAMHIPDGYLSPTTSLVMFLVISPF
jgi:hypothetical protein